jgi:hypothetical protein
VQVTKSLVAMELLDYPMTARVILLYFVFDRVQCFLRIGITLKFAQRFEKARVVKIQRTYRHPQTPHPNPELLSKSILSLS